MSTGVSFSEANAHKSLEIGNATLVKMDGQNVTHYTFKKDERIIQMGAKVEIGKEKMICYWNVRFLTWVQYSTKSHGIKEIHMDK